MTSINTQFGSKRPIHPAVLEWVKKVSLLTKPDMIFWCDGSEEEKNYLLSRAVKEGVLCPLDQKKWPGCYYHRSHPNDVARIEQCTFVCTETREEAGPTNNWMEPKRGYQKLYEMLQGSMRGRTLFVIPYLMGPPQSILSKVGIELTDSIYVVLNMRLMTRMGNIAYQLLHENDFNHGIHSLLDCNPERRFICHFPADNTIISVGSGYGGNALLGKKCFALRVGSVLGEKQGWLAEHMLLLCVEDPTGEKFYVAAAFPSACGKTNFAMMIPPQTLQGWTITTIGDDIAWMCPGADGLLRAINPETGYFGVVAGTNGHSNPNAMRCIEKDTIFTNIAVTVNGGDIWWEGKDNKPPENLLDWQGNPWKPESGQKAAHPNGRFTAPMCNNPMLAKEVDDPRGVPINAIIFGGRRATTMPLVFEAFNWIHGIYIGSTVSSEMTAAAIGKIGQVRRDPMAMLPFCGYNMGNYFRHWLNMGRRLTTLPRVFHVNWFRKNLDGNYLWPGYGENMRILKWIIERCKHTTGALESPIGWIPRYQDLDWSGLPAITAGQFDQLMKIDSKEWLHELTLQGEFFMKIYHTLPKELIYQRELLIARL